MSAMPKEEIPNLPSIGSGFVTNLYNLAEQIFLRPDPKYRFFWDQAHGVPISDSTVSQMRLGDCLLPYVPRMIPKGDLGETRRIIELADVEAYTSILILDAEESERTVSEVGSTKLDFDGCDLVITRLRPYLGEVVLNDQADPFIGTSEWIPLKLRNTHLEPLFLKYLLLLPQYLNALGRMMSGKEHPRVREEQLFHLKIPLPSIQSQHEAVEKIKILEQQLQSKHRSLPKPNAVINAIFANEFSYELGELKTLNEAMYQLDIRDFDTSFDLVSFVGYLGAFLPVSCGTCRA